MYIQVTNTTLSKFNIIRSTKDTLIKDVAKMGWKLNDCKLIQLQPFIFIIFFKSRID